MESGQQKSPGTAQPSGPARRVRLSDKYDLSQSRVLLTGTQAIVRLALMQKARDTAAGLNTAGYVTGYRGSPLATVDNAFESAHAEVAASDIQFQPAINEELAATALWGAQQAELRGEGRFDGVFGIWYAKGPGVDRAGDALRHANHAGTSPNGGVLALMGDDHTCESSTSAHQSEFAFIDAMIPILAPTNVQEIIDYGLIGFALSRFAGVWVGMKCVKDNAEGTGTVDASLDRIALQLPGTDEYVMPPGGLNIRLGDTPLSREARLHDHKRAAILAFAKANNLDRLIYSGGGRPRIGIITAGKSYADTRQALEDLGIDEARAETLGMSLLKVAMVWPLQPSSIRRFARGLDLIVVVEEKRAVMESQIRDILYDIPDRPRIIGKTDADGNTLFPANGALEPLDIALAIGERISARHPTDAQLSDLLSKLQATSAQRPSSPEDFSRTAYFCAGCPHNTSTRVPEGARAYAGIGCHYMAQWMDRDTDGFTQMGGEGANWIGEAPFSKRSHVFQNIGDGTFVHSGSLALRAAIAAGTNVTFKILYNDAVAMTGGQPLEGGMTAAQMAASAVAEGAKRVDVVTDDTSRYRFFGLPRAVRIHHRRDLDAVQRELAGINGVTVLIYDQTCAAEKRRRRRRGTMPDPAKRVAINARVCEGCGDCGKASNCVAILPLETEYGRKRQIDQSACNKDFSCIEGFCPSFVTLHGAQVRTQSASLPGTSTLAPEPMPEPTRPGLARPYSILATGIGGTGVVTISAVLGQAAHIAGYGFGAIDVTGIAQKGGAVACHIRIAESPEDIHAIKVGTARADLVLGGDLVVTASNKILETIAPGRTHIVASNEEVITGDFTRKPGLEVPGAALVDLVENRSAGGPLLIFNPHDLARRLFGDTIFANMMLLGAAYQRGAIPIPAPAIEEAIALNGAAADKNQLAFRYGRMAAYAPDKLAQRLETDTASHDASAQRGRPANDISANTALDALVDARAAELTAYQDQALADRYRTQLAAIREAETSVMPGATQLSEAAAHGYFKLLAVKDEWEVARLYTDGRFLADIDRDFTDVTAMTFHIAPPLLARKDPRTGHPRKIAVSGRVLMPALKWMAKRRHWRGTWADPFSRTAERRRERELAISYEADLGEIAKRLTPQTHTLSVELANLPESIRGFGHVKLASIEAAETHRASLLKCLRTGAPTPAPHTKQPVSGNTTK